MKMYGEKWAVYIVFSPQQKEDVLIINSHFCTWIHGQHSEESNLISL